MPNFKKLSKTYEKNALLALQSLIRIESVYDEKTAKKGAPYGEGVKAALDYVAKLGTDYGWAVDRCDGYCTELTVGDEGPIIGVFAHSDVVPAAGSWKHPPFSATLEDGVIYGRGAADDKGPLVAALYAIKLLKDNGFIRGYRVRLVSGGDEERGSSCLHHYFREMKKEAPAYGFTPDAEWPLIYGEKAIRRYDLAYEGQLGPIIAMKGGTVANAVCESVLVTLQKDPGLSAFLKKKGIKADVTESEGIDIVSFKGKTAHGSTPEKGVNAIAIAFRALGERYEIPGLVKMAEAIASPDGSAFGGDSKSPELGAATYNYGVIDYNGKRLSISLDFRFGETADPDALIKKLEAYTGLKANLVSDTKPLLFDKESLLVSTLMKAYKKETHDRHAAPFTIGGGTYAKEAPNCVAFGASWPNHPGDEHSPNEYIYVEDLYKDIAIYARAIYLLGKLVA